MPRGPQTRGHWVNFNIEARGNHANVISQAKTAWNRRTPAERAQWVRHYLAHRAAEEAVHEPMEDADAARTIADELRQAHDPAVDPREIDWPEAIAAAMRALRFLRACIPLQKALVIASRRNAASVAVMLPHDDVLEYANDIRDEEAQSYQNVRTWIQQYHGHAFRPALPPRPDGKLKLPELWVPPEKLDVRADTRLVAFRTGASGHERPGERWMGSWVFGQGGISTSGLWVRLNLNDTVIDRVVRKDTYKTREEWSQANEWDGNLRDPNSRRPYEIACHHDMQQNVRALSHINVPTMRQFDVDDDLKRYRIYMSFCGHGNLGDLIKRHRAAHRRIPEPFLWRVFESLATLGYAMEHGHTPDLQNPPPNWEEVVHRDLKPSNVFLDDRPTTGNWQSYCVPKLGDFGCAFQTNATDPLNPEIFLDGTSTVGFRAPEQTSYVDYITLDPIDRFKMLAHTNVWGVGTIMYALATLQRSPPQRSFLGDARADQNDMHTDPTGSRYSFELQSLINQCIRFDPVFRPTFTMVLNRIATALHIGRARGMDGAPNWHIPWADARRPLDINDDWRMGLQQVMLPPM